MSQAQAQKSALPAPTAAAPRLADPAAGVGLPAPLRAGITALSGLDLGDVKVHHRSAAPARIGALAYARGDAIHLGPGQERHLAHEAWHIVQQRQGRVAPQWQAAGMAINHQPALELEADLMGAAAAARGASLPAVQGLPPGLRDGSRAALPVAQCAYATLEALDRARVDARSARAYTDKAADFEHRLGNTLAEAPEPLVAVNAMLDSVRKIVNAWADRTGQTKLNVYSQEFKFDEGDKYFGAFTMSGEAIKKVFHSRDRFGKAQPARKKLKVIYNAVRNNNLAKWLKVASDELAERQAAALAVRLQAPVTVVRAVAPNTLVGAQVENVRPGFAHGSGLEQALGVSGRHADVQQASAQEKLPMSIGGGPPRPVHIAAPDRFSSIARGTALESGAMDIANRDRQYQQNLDVAYAHQHTLRTRDLPDLTADEIRLLQTRQTGVDPGALNSRAKSAFKARGDDQLSWEQGRDAIAVLLNSPVDRAAEDIGARLEAGVSGSTSMMYVAAKNLGLGDPAMLQRLRLAMLGWMLPNHDHSFYEIMQAADIQGVPFTTNPLLPGYQYEAAQNYLPMAVAPLQNLLPEQQFPRWFLGGGHKDALSDQLRAQSDAGLNNLLRLRGLTDDAINALDYRAKAEVVLLAEDIRSAAFQPIGVGTPQQQRVALAANRLQTRQLRERSSFRWLWQQYQSHAELWLMRMLAAAHKPLSEDQEALRQVGPTTLPALAANAAAQRLWLATAGIPAGGTALVANHYLADLVLLARLTVQLAFDPAQEMHSAANQPRLDNLLASSSWARLAGLGTRDALVGLMLDHRYGAITVRGFHDARRVNPRARVAMARGVPDGLARSIGAHRDSNLVFNHLDAIHAEVTRILTLAPALRMADLQLFIANSAAWRLWIDQSFGTHRFDLIVAGMAHQANIDLAASPHLLALARAAAAQSSGLAIAPAAFGLAGFHPLGLTMAENTLKANLGVPTLVGTPWHNLLLPQELASIKAYSMLGGMGAWQAAVRGLDTTAPGASDKLVRLAPRILAAVSGLRKLPVAPGPVYNGSRPDLVGRPDQALRAFPLGMVWSPDNFLSTARSVAASFIPKLAPVYAVAIEITRVRSGRDIQKIALNAHEEEVLFAPGARFLVVEVTDQTDLLAYPAGHGKVWVRMVEL